MDGSQYCSTSQLWRTGGQSGSPQKPPYGLGAAAGQPKSLAGYATSRHLFGRAPSIVCIFFFSLFLIRIIFVCGSLTFVAFSSHGPTPVLRAVAHLLYGNRI